MLPFQLVVFPSVTDIGHLKFTFCSHPLFVFLNLLAQFNYSDLDDNFLTAIPGELRTVSTLQELWVLHFQFNLRPASRQLFELDAI